MIYNCRSRNPSRTRKFAEPWSIQDTTQGKLSNKRPFGASPNYRRSSSVIKAQSLLTGRAKMHASVYMRASTPGYQFIPGVLDCGVNQAEYQNPTGAETEEEVYPWQIQKPCTQSDPFLYTWHTSQQTSLLVGNGQSQETFPSLF